MTTQTGEWVLLCYRLPREPSTPRIAVWRRLRALGVAQLADGLVTLPADARTREQLEWIAQEVSDAGGEASLWLARPGTREQERQVAARMAEARAAEYAEVRAAAEQSGAGHARTAKRLQAELRRIQRRDYFPPRERDLAQAAVRALHDAPARAER